MLHGFWNVRVHAPVYHIAVDRWKARKEGCTTVALPLRGFGFFCLQLRASLRFCQINTNWIGLSADPKGGRYNSSPSHYVGSVFLFAINCKQACVTGKQKAPLLSGAPVVGKTGFEPATPCTPYKCATGLRHFPKKTWVKIYIKRLQNSGLKLAQSA